MGTHWITFSDCTLTTLF